MHPIFRLQHWFSKNKRSFPWRENPTPYAVWISEIMLQQTRASVVVQYFLKWMETFPTLLALAEAPIEKVIKSWEGLGYYSRARNIHSAAQLFTKEGIPTSASALLKIKGIGPYTAGAIASFAYHHKEVAIDSNVSRVIARYFGIEQAIHKEKTKEEIKAKTLLFLEHEEPWVIMEALIELGATHCQKKPSCKNCPLQQECQAFSYNKTSSIPSVKKRKKTVFLETPIALIVYQKKLLIRLPQKEGLFHGIALLPYGDIAHDLIDTLHKVNDLPIETQSYLHYREKLIPTLWVYEKEDLINGYRWCCWEEVQALPFASGHKRILQNPLIVSILA